MDTLITVVTNSDVFFKQITQIFVADFKNGRIKYVRAGEDLSQEQLIVTDGCDKRVYDECVPVFVIADEIPQGVHESMTLRFYKKGELNIEDFVNDVYGWAEIIVALEETTQAANEADKKRAAYKRKLDDYERNLKKSALLQASVMNPKAPSGFDMAIHYQPVANVSGDIVVVEEIGSKVYAVVGDVTGHGYFAGMYGTSLYSLVRGYFSLASQFDMTLEGLVRFVQHSSSFYQPTDIESSEMFSIRQETIASMIFCEIDKASCVVRFVNCGHGSESPILVDSEGKASVVPFNKEGAQLLQPVGDFKMKPPTSVLELPFLPGSCLVMYTDGATEVFRDENAKNIAEGYSLKRLYESVCYEVGKKKWSAQSVATGIVKDAESYAISPELTCNATNGLLDEATDDVTILVLRWEKEE